MSSQAKTVDPQDTVRLSLSGRFCILAPSGEVLTPKAVKQQALLALLASSRTGERGRGWLQDKLWSTRAPEQASNSLRQALSGIRRSLRDWQDVFETDHTSVRLRLDMVEVLDLPTDGEFLEGIDVRDAEFEEWLSLERSHRQQSIVLPMVSSRRAERRSISLVANGAPNEQLAYIENYLADIVAHTLRENLSVDVYSVVPNEVIADLLVARVQAMQPDPHTIAIRVSAENNSTNRILWSGHETLKTSSLSIHENEDLLALGNQLVNALADHLLIDADHSTERRNATQLGLSALKALFTMNEDQVSLADQNLKAAYDLDPRGIFLSWRAQLRGIQLVERHGVDINEVIDTGMRFADAALLDDPNNSMVLATVSNARLILDRDVSGATHLSQQSIQENPANPLAWWARSAASLYAEQHEDSYRHAKRGFKLAKGSPYRYWWDMQSALAAAVTGRVSEAIDMAERCAAFAPTFRPPLRYLIALYTATGQLDLASRKVERLMELEPDFSVDRLAHDPNYPVSLMRRTKLVSPNDLMRLDSSS